MKVYWILIAILFGFGLDRAVLGVECDVQCESGQLKVCVKVGGVNCKCSCSKGWGVVTYSLEEIMKELNAPEEAKEAVEQAYQIWKEAGNEDESFVVEFERISYEISVSEVLVEELDARGEN